MIACKSLSVFVLSPSLGFLGEGDIVSQTIHEAQQLLRGGQGPASRERDGSTRLVSQRLKAASTEHCLTHTHIYTLHFSSLRRGWSVAPGACRLSPRNSVTSENVFRVKYRFTPSHLNWGSV